MPTYTLTVLIKNDIDDGKRKEILDTLKEKIENDGRLIKEDLWGSRNLVYPIKHQNRAYFALMEFEKDPGSILSLDKTVKLNEDIIRYLLIRKS